MVIEYIKRNLTQSLTNSGGDTEATIGGNVYVMNQTAATSATLTVTHTGGTVGTAMRMKWMTSTTFPNQLDWGGGTYTWHFRVTGTQPSITMVEAIVRRMDSTGSTVKASKSSGAISVNLGTSGVKSDTIIWDDGTQNPTNKAQTDRFEVVFRFTQTGTMSTSASVGCNLSGSQDEVNTPIDASAGPSPVVMTVTSKILTNKFITKI